MIHQVNAPEEDVDLLLQIVDLQLFLLELAAQHEELTASSETDGPGNIEIELRTYYEDDQKANQVTKWLTRKEKDFGALRAFAAHDNQGEKKEFVGNLRHDVELIDNPREARLRVSIDKDDSSNWEQAAGRFLKAFYSYLSSSSGFPRYLFQTTRDKPYTRWDFINGFTNVNPTLSLCAICDSSLYRKTIDGKPYTSVEHFFPKSRYPHLAIHPYNLIPICTSCNSGAAGATDPLGEDDYGILGLLLPYQTRPELTEQRPGLKEQTYIAVKLRAEKQEHPLELEMLPDVSHPDAGILIRNFERIYKVQGHWNDDMEVLDQHVFRRITQFLMGDVQSGNQLEDSQFLVDRLKLLMAIVSKENLGQDPFGFATIWLIKYHIDSLQSSADHPKDVPIYAALHNWASDQQGRWQEYREYADEVIARVPGPINDDGS